MECEDEGASETKGSDEQQGGGSQVTRSYECTFCKRGFSNAQALGGHMNIHRKDKAKLRQSSNPLPHHHHHQPSSNINIHKVEDIRSMNNPAANWPNWNSMELEDASSRDHHRDETLTTSSHSHVVHIRKLQLFAETPNRGEEGEIHDGEKGTVPSAGQGSSSDLDLELRLGPDPQEHHPSRSPTRKFF